MFKGQLARSSTFSSASTGRRPIIWPHTRASATTCIGYSWFTSFPIPAGGTIRYAAVVPTVYTGKGFGRFDVQSSLGATLPVADTLKLGRVVEWNTVAQYHLGKYLWPEIEDNASFYHAGPNDGGNQETGTGLRRYASCCRRR